MFINFPKSTFISPCPKSKIVYICKKKTQNIFH